MQDNSDLARFLARNKNLASFLASVACKIFTIFLQDMQENGHFAWTSCKISKKYRKVRPRLWDLACMILARIVDELARWFDLGKLKIISLNCCSLRSKSKRNQLAVLLTDYDADIILGCESHIDHTFFSPEILPAGYKIIRKDRCLGGGGVFIGYKNYLNVCEESSLSLDAEMVWVKLCCHNKKNLPVFILSTT